MTTDSNDPKHILADNGKVFRRIASGEIFGSEIFLGFSYYINGVRQIPPHQDTVDDFEEIDVPPDNVQEE